MKVASKAVILKAIETIIEDNDADAFGFEFTAAEIYKKIVEPLIKALEPEKLTNPY